MSQVQITEEEVKHLAHLVKISLSEDEVKKYQKQFVNILNYVSQLNEVDTTSVKPYEWDLAEGLRPDTPKKSLSRENVLKNSKNKNDKFFVVPAVVTK